MTKDLDAVIAGYVGVDLAPTFPASDAVSLGQLLRPGKLVEVGPLEITPGGVVANTGLAMSVFGSRAALEGLVGDDQLGKLLQRLLEGRGAEVHLQVSSADPTAYGLVIAPPGTDRVFLECPGCNATFTSFDVDYDLVARSRLFHFGYPPLMPAMVADSGAELVAMFSRARERGVATSLDMTLPDPEGATRAADWRALLARVLPLLDVFVPSLEELLAMLRPAEWARLTESADADPVELIPPAVCEELADEVVALGASIVLVKCGARGGYLRTASRVSVPSLPLEGWEDQRLWLKPFVADPARVQNACGAGDAAVAGFLTALLRGESPQRAGRLAMLAGRDSLYGVDTTSGLRTWDQMLTEVVS